LNAKPESSSRFPSALRREAHSFEEDAENGILARSSAKTLVAHAAPGLAHDILITIDEERVLIFRWRRLATRESPRTAAGPILVLS
jgi:hypothetical protein